MYKTFALVSLVFIMITLTACGNAALAAPDNQPASIQDPLLQEAWTRLNEHTEQVKLWDWRSLSGHDLAQFVVQNAIPIQWDTGNVCNGNSCSVRYRLDGIWGYDDGQPGVEPIYIDASVIKLVDGRMGLIIEFMAHEIYHRIQPYGMTSDSLYEEFSAYYISTHISGSSSANSEAYDPRKPGCLTRWFIDNNIMYGYVGMDLYPESVAASIDLSDQSCLLPGEVASSIDNSAASQESPAVQVDVNYTLDCRANSLGLIVCQKIEDK